MLIFYNWKNKKTAPNLIYQTFYLFLQISDNGGNNKSLKNSMVKYNITNKKEKEANYRSLVSPKLMDELEQKINDIIIIKKKYKEKNYSAKQLAEDLNTNTRYISAVVNVRFHMNYTSYVNKYRIQEAMSLLVDKRYQELNMEDISDMVGFANRQSFYASFYKINGITPREYRMEHLKSHPSLTGKPKKRGRKPGSKNKSKTMTPEM